MSLAASTPASVRPQPSSPVQISREGDRWRLTSRQIVPRPLGGVFAFYADAFNLEAITPPFLRFRVLTPAPIEMHEGLAIDYALRVRGVPIRWRSEIPVWEPPHRFVDRQVKGPYSLWHHEHRFESAGNSTVVIDEVDYRPPGGPLAGMVNALAVRRDLLRIFEYRRRRIAELLGGERRRGSIPDQPPVSPAFALRT